MRIRLNGAEMFYTMSGAGPPVVLVHGYPLDHSIWQPQIDHLSHNYRVLAMDLRGHGQSQPSPGPYTMDLLARDVSALIDHLQLGPVVLGGLSMGGYVAFAFMREFARKACGLILADTRAEADTPEAKSRRETQAKSVLKNGAAEIVSQLLPKMLTEKTAKENPQLVSKVRKIMESTSPVGIAGALEGMAQRPDSTSLLESLKVPTLVIVGSQDTVTTVDDAQNMARRIRDSELVIIPDAAHLTTLENPREVNAAIGRFVRRIFG